MKNLNSIFKLMVKVSLPLLVFLGVILWASGLNNSAIAVNCCMHDGYYDYSSWLYSAEPVVCCDDEYECEIKTRLIEADYWSCEDDDCDEPYFDPYDQGECWYPCCYDARVIQQNDGCEETDLVTVSFYEHRVYGTCYIDCFCNHNDPCTSWFEPIDSKHCVSK